MDLWIANEASLQKTLPSSIVDEVPNEKVVPLEELNFQIKPFVIEGSVETFDPVLRAIDMSKKLSRKWCGTLNSFLNESSKDVSVFIDKAKPYGQLINLEGNIVIGNFKTPFHGHLNAKSDQFELIPLSNTLPPGLEPGGSFVGLQSTKILGWQSPKLNNPGAKLILNNDCKEEVSKAPSVISIW